jgi:hypothetical protein
LYVTLFGHTLTIGHTIRLRRRCPTQFLAHCKAHKANAQKPALFYASGHTQSNMTRSGLAI